MRVYVTGISQVSARYPEGICQVSARYPRATLAPLQHTAALLARYPAGICQVSRRYLPGIARLAICCYSPAKPNAGGFMAYSTEAAKTKHQRIRRSLAESGADPFAIAADALEKADRLEAENKRLSALLGGCEPVRLLQVAAAPERFG